jgi:adenylate cyclase
MDQHSHQFRVLRISLPANLLGAVVTFGYFRYVDPSAFTTRRPGLGEILYFIAFFGALLALGYWLGDRWSRPLKAGSPPPGPAGDDVRRRAIHLPWVIAALTAVGWCLAGLIWGVLWPLLAGGYETAQALRTVFGITVIAGSAATAFMFFAIERQWRQRLPSFFPEGGLTQIRGALRLPVRARLLVVFLLVSVIPVSVLGMLARSRAREALAAGPLAADAIVANMLVSVVFLAVASIVVSVVLALFVSRSVAEPLATLESVMREVERGRLDARAPVVCNDEIGRLTEGFNRMVRGLGEREFLRETFGKYVSEEIRDEILAGRIALHGEPREVTILFADIRDFTPWVEATDPREVVRDLNAYFTEMETAIRAHGGLVVQYIGDEIEAVFGAPVARPGHAGQAVRAAIEMRARLHAWNATRVGSGRAPLRNGIGIHTGTVLAGNIGSADRLSYALVGDSVNLASRLQGLTKELHADVLVSGTTRARIDGDPPLRPLPAVRVKGRVAEVEVYALG